MRFPLLEPDGLGVSPGLEWRSEGKANLSGSAVATEDADRTFDLDGDLGRGARVVAFGLSDRAMTDSGDKGYGYPLTG